MQLIKEYDHILVYDNTLLFLRLLSTELYAKNCMQKIYIYI